MKKILVPTDFSVQSINAFRFALEIAARSGGMVGLLHVLALPVLHDNPLLPVDEFRKPLIDELMALAEQKIAKINSEFNERKATVEANVVVSNRIHQTIVDTVNKEEYELVVMGTKGASGLREWMIGSNTEKMVRTSPVPVIAIKQFHPGQVIRHIVFPNTLDTENQEDLIMKVKALQDFFQAKLHIIWINTPAVFKPDDEARRQLKAFAQRFMLTNYTINVFNYSDEESGIVEFANQVKGDLIAMGTHGLTGIAHYISGSLAEDVVNHVPYPVWTYCSKYSRVSVEN